jgi:hypothetical protein
MRACICALIGAVGLAVAPAASADIGLRLTTLDVRVGGLLRGTGNGGGMAVYIVPESRAHRPYRCNKPRPNGICQPRFFRPPRAPYIFLGRMPGRARDYRGRRFAFRVPRIAPGRYQVAVWCRPCGGGLILAGDTIYGQVVRVRG